LIGSIFLLLGFGCLWTSLGGTADTRTNMLLYLTYGFMSSGIIGGVMAYFAPVYSLSPTLAEECFVLSFLFAIILTHQLIRELPNGSVAVPDTMEASGLGTDRSNFHVPGGI
jgi:hypothetical protein